MKRMTFVKAVVKYQNRVVKSFTDRRVERALAHDALQEAVMSLLKNKAYKKFESDVINQKVYSFIKVSAYKSMSNILRQRANEQVHVTSIDAMPDEDEDISPIENTRDSKECPFCHTPDSLNQYNACDRCHTILGNGKTRREQFVVEDAEPLTVEDLDMKLDVEKALGTLSEIEQVVVNAVVHNVETLEDIAIRTDIPKTNLWRIYVKAKHKLEAQLLEYAFQK